MASKKSVTNTELGLVSLALVRISLGLIFLWAFFDKLWGLGFATCRDAKSGIVTTMCPSAWIEGGSPTSGFLGHATKGPLAGFYQGLAGNNFVDWLFMLGLLLIGITLVAGIANKISTISASVLLLMMWSAVLPPANHPLLDDHLVYIFALMAVMSFDDKQKFGLRSWWLQQKLVKKNPILQ